MKKKKPLRKKKSPQRISKIKKVTNTILRNKRLSKKNVNKSKPITKAKPYKIRISPSP